jgi:hypothetical protein
MYEQQKGAQTLSQTKYFILLLIATCFGFREKQLKGKRKNISGNFELYVIIFFMYFLIAWWYIFTKANKCSSQLKQQQN